MDVVDNLLKNSDDFSMPVQELLAEFCWGAAWGRPELDRRSRSSLNLEMIAALNGSEELANYMRIAIEIGLTKEEIRECFLQVAVYVGMPAALSIFKVALQVFDEASN
ncbi:4-carboxymuconolactone decarboxylase [Caballeronia calidae]|uniref:4-carboxymuconolactone decarboxylase n=1 Tax=Caballeronia calidae TaxID=1777139 RepID=A0A158A8A1_9BURK|nr:carboxymuconolactone decarboxylase family protein [Caballeronia calidae]SAK54051.1 4-carboxymuconolactone decarboxylase [Caballeronia calidae]